MTNDKFREEIIKQDWGFNPLPIESELCTPEVVRQIAARQRSLLQSLAPYDRGKKFVAEVEERGKVKDVDLARELAVAQAASEFLEEPLHPGFIRIIKSRLMASVEWGREHGARARANASAAAHRLHNQWQKMADEHWRVNPNLSASQAARLISRKLGVNWNTVRRAIRKKR
jgi:hypothetical protein